MVGGPLLDAGHDVKLLDAECQRLAMPALVDAVQRFGPDIVMTGHAGSTPAHPVCVEMLRAIKAACPDVVTVYGGPYPTYHAGEILAREPAVDFIVRGEGEATAVDLVTILAAQFCNHPSQGARDERDPCEAAGLPHVDGIAYRANGQVRVTNARSPIKDLDAFRIGWELISDWDDYQCFGLGRASIVQFSRGCPHQCTYCGQYGFWVRWRHRDVVRFVDEIEWLHRTHHINFFTLADENPTTLKVQWRHFLEEVSARRLPVHFFATIRASDIVRDADIMPLYRKAGILYVLMGIESTSEQVLRQIKKGSTARQDFEACQLLKQHGIFSVIGHIVGFGDETWATFRTALRQLCLYDGDYVNAMYVTPHSWTPFSRNARSRLVAQMDQRKWDYRHQVLAQNHLAPWQLFARVKWLEWCFHLRPRRLWAILREPNRDRLRMRMWVYLHIGLVWLAEILEFVLATSFSRTPVTLGELHGNVSALHSPPHLPLPSPLAARGEGLGVRGVGPLARKNCQTRILTSVVPSAARS
jgi:anaerobic magnesium-protoporphyrin IX monomethyl ester cyclase